MLKIDPTLNKHTTVHSLIWASVRDNEHSRNDAPFPGSVVNFNCFEIGSTLSLVETSAKYSTGGSQQNHG